MVNETLIKPNLAVVCSENGQFAVVDHLEGRDTIKLKKDKQGTHHYIPLSWVERVDDKVHIDRPGDQAMRDWSTYPPNLDKLMNERATNEGMGNPPSNPA